MFGMTSTNPDHERLALASTLTQRAVELALADGLKEARRRQEAADQAALADLKGLLKH